MKEFIYIIKDPNGLHARPAGKLASLAKRFSCDIRVKTNQKEADCKRLLSLMSLGAIAGTSLTFTLAGDDEQEALSALSSACPDILGGGEPT